ncbi:MAG: NAD(+)/NADH kinase [Alphaproteobacteria bacterium]
MARKPHPDARVGILANPASGRDIRRLVASASVFPTAEKANMVERLLTGLASAGVGTAFVMPDRGGIASRLRQAIEREQAMARNRWPRVAFIEMPIEDGPLDTVRAVERMLAEGVGAIISLGGDGTNRLIASVSGATPLLPLSTGTNNVFPVMREATIAGLAAGLVASGRVDGSDALEVNKLLRVTIDGASQEIALIDLCVVSELWVATKALWRPEHFRELFLAFAEPDAIGLSAIGGLLQPVARAAENGLRLELAPPEKAASVVLAPIGPGLIVPIGVNRIEELKAGQAVELKTREGVIALDGEREIEFRNAGKVSVRLDRRGPTTIRIDKVMALAAARGLLADRSGAEE